MRWVAVLACLLVSWCPAEAGNSAFFPVGIWYEGGVGAVRDGLIPEDPKQAFAYYRHTLADIARHGLNLVVVPNTPANHHRLLLDAAQQAKLRLIIELGLEGGEIGHLVRSPQSLTAERARAAVASLITPIKRHPALYGIQILDEPPPPAFGNYAVAKSAIEELSGKPAFCCLIGGGGVGEFCRQVKPKQVAFDHYPIGETTPIGDRGPLESFLSSCRQAAEASRPQGVPAWAVIQAHSITGIHRHPTPAELRLMTYLALSEGVRGIFYFLYQTEFFTRNPPRLMEGVATEEYHETVQFRAIRRLASELKWLSPVLLTLEPSAPPLVSGQAEGVHLTAWKDRRGTHYLIGVNLDVKQSARVLVQLSDSRVSTAATLEDVLTGKTVSQTERAATSTQFPLELEPGGTHVYRVVELKRGR